ncbi:MAG: hypothetical protein ACRCUY_05850 [Thermoguttaceae bacterium]
MMMLLCALVGSVSFAADKPDSRNLPALELVVLVDDHTIEIRQFAEGMVTRTTFNSPSSIRKQKKDGNIVPRTYTEVVPVVSTATFRVPISEIVAQHLDGSPIPVNVLMAKLADTTPVIKITQDHKINPLFAKIFEPNSLVHVWPPSIFTSTPIQHLTTSEREKDHYTIARHKLHVLND